MEHEATISKVSEVVVETVGRDDERVGRVYVLSDRVSAQAHGDHRAERDGCVRADDRAAARGGCHGRRVRPHPIEAELDR